MLNPLAKVTAWLQAYFRHYPALESLPGWWYDVVSPILAILLGIGTLYFLGLALQSWVYRWVEWMMMKVPIVNTIYRAVSNVVRSLGSQLQSGGGFKRVVLVEFPHPGMRSLGLVTNSLRDVATGRTILTVYIMTGIMPPAGFTLFVPEDSVTNIAWNVNDTLQAILSGGITTPPTIHYVEGLRHTPPRGGRPDRQRPRPCPGGRRRASGDLREAIWSGQRLDEERETEPVAPGNEGLATPCSFEGGHPVRRGPPSGCGPLRNGVAPFEARYWTSAAWRPPPYNGRREPRSSAPALGRPDRMGPGTPHPPYGHLLPGGEKGTTLTFARRLDVAPPRSRTIGAGLNTCRRSRRGRRRRTSSRRPWVRRR